VAATRRDLEFSCGLTRWATSVQCTTPIGLKPFVHPMGYPGNLWQFLINSGGPNSVNKIHQNNFNKFQNTFNNSNSNPYYSKNTSNKFEMIAIISLSNICKKNLEQF
jgi:hypothetical protein